MSSFSLDGYSQRSSFCFSSARLERDEERTEDFNSELGGFRRRGVDRKWTSEKMKTPNRMTYLILVLYLETLDSHCSKFCLTLNPRTGD